jgi:hypothetical protein
MKYILFRQNSVFKVVKENMAVTQTHERLRWRGPATTENYRPDLSSERASHVNKPVTV